MEMKGEKGGAGAGRARAAAQMLAGMLALEHRPLPLQIPSLWNLVWSAASGERPVPAPLSSPLNLPFRPISSQLLSESLSEGSPHARARLRCYTTMLHPQHRHGGCYTSVESRSKASGIPGISGEQEFCPGYRCPNCCEWCHDCGIDRRLCLCEDANGRR
jgi:hypothetical protein